MVMTACAGGGASDTVGASAAAAGAATSTINLYAYAVPKVGFDKLIPAFNATAAGKGVQFQQSYGASGDQSRKVAAGAAADFVNFSVEPDITRLVDAGLVDQDWNANQYKGIPFGSVVTIVVRKGNPKGIKDWDDLLKPGRRGRHAEPVQLRLGQVEPARPVCRQERRRQEPGRGPRLHHPSSSATTSRCSRSRAARRPRRSSRAPATCCSATRTRRCSPSATVTRSSTSRRRRRSRSRTPRPCIKQEQEPREGQGLQRLPLHAGGAEAVGRGRVPPGRPDGGQGVRGRLPGSRRSCGRSTTSVAGRRSTAPCSRRTTGSIARDLRQGDVVDP